MNAQGPTTGRAEQEGHRLTYVAGPQRVMNARTSRETQAPWAVAAAVAAGAVAAVAGAAVAVPPKTPSARWRRVAGTGRWDGRWHSRGSLPAGPASPRGWGAARRPACGEDGQWKERRREEGRGGTGRRRKKGAQENIGRQEAGGSGVRVACRRPCVARMHAGTHCSFSRARLQRRWAKHRQWATALRRPFSHSTRSHPHAPPTHAARTRQP